MTDFAPHLAAPPWHSQSGHLFEKELTNMNHLYADGHVQTIPGRQVLERQNYHYQVLC